MKNRIVAFLLLSVNVALARPAIITQTDIHTVAENHPKVFLGGSLITPWRDRLITLLRDTNYTLYNPAHPEIPGRIEWEQSHIEKADILLMWIAKNTPRDSYTLSLTSLFELGRFIEMEGKTLIVGIDPDYAMHEELTLQLRRLRPELTIFDSIDSLAASLKKHWQSRTKSSLASAHQQASS